MKKLKTILLSFVMLAAGSVGTISYNYFTGDVPIADFMTQIKTLVATAVVSLGGAGGVVLLAQYWISQKVNEYKKSIDTMVANNEISVAAAETVKELLTTFEQKANEKLNEMGEQNEALFEENTQLKQVNHELVDKINNLMEAIGTAFLTPDSEVGE